MIQKNAAPRLGDPVRLVFTLGGCGHSLGGVVLRTSDNGFQTYLGIAFAGDQAEAIDLLASSLSDLDIARAG